MSEQEEQAVEEAVAETQTYDPYDDLIHRRAGVQCPGCREVVFSESRYEYTKCRCEVTYVTGGISYLKFGVNAPYSLTDARVIRRYIYDAFTPEVEEPKPLPIDEVQLHQEVVEELSQVAEEDIIIDAEVIPEAAPTETPNEVE